MCRWLLHLLLLLPASAWLGPSRLPRTGTVLRMSRAAPTPWEREKEQSQQTEEEVTSKPNERLLGPGANIAVSGAEGKLGRLVTKRLFQQQFRPHLLVRTAKDAPRGIGLEQYKGLTRYISDSDPFPSNIKGLLLVREGGNTEAEVRGILRRAEMSDVKRVVMVSATGVERRGDLVMKIKCMGTDLEQRHKAEAALLELSGGGEKFDYVIVRTGKLRGGGGEKGLGYEFYDANGNIFEAQGDEKFDLEHRGFTMSFSDNIHGDTSRVLAAETVVKALSSDGVTDVALSVVSEPGRTYHNFEVAPWDLF